MALAEYKTQQKEVLLGFLYAHRDTPMSVEEISERLRGACDNAPGKSTVYRLMGRLCEEGSVKRFEKGNSRTFLYQFAGGEACRHHLHLRCLSCGRLLHMDHAQSERLLQEIYGGSGAVRSKTISSSKPLQTSFSPSGFRVPCRFVSDALKATVPSVSRSYFSPSV